MGVDALLTCDSTAGRLGIKTLALAPLGHQLRPLLLAALREGNVPCARGLRVPKLVQ